MIALVPIPYGSNWPLAWIILQIAAFSLLAWHLLLTGFRQSVSHRPLSKNVIIVLSLLCAWLVYIGIQILPIPDAILRTLSQQTYNIYRHIDENLTGFYGHLSIDSYATRGELLKNIAYISLFYLTVSVVNSRFRVKILIYIMVIVGTAEAMVGLLGYFTGHEVISFAFMGNLNKDYTIGTFINRNHYANFMAIIVPLGAGLAFSDTHYISSAINSKDKIVHFIDELFSHKSILTLLIIIMLSAIVLSESRGAVLSLFIASILVFLITKKNNKHGYWSRYKIPVYVSLIIAIVIAWNGIGGIKERFNAEDLVKDERLQLLSIEKPIFTDHYLLGTGAGSFETSFLMHRDESLRPIVYDHAHNDYLETLIELGIIGTLLLGAAIFMAMFYIYDCLRKTSSSFKKSILTGVLVSLFTMLIHASLDFSFRIPANAVYFYIVLALGLTVSSTSMKRSYMDF